MVAQETSDDNSLGCRFGGCLQLWNPTLRCARAILGVPHILFLQPIPSSPSARLLPPTASGKKGNSAAGPLRAPAPAPRRLHAGKLRSELAALGAGPYLSAPLPMAAHLSALRSQSPRSSSLGLVPFSERIQLLASKLPVAAQVRRLLLGACPLPRPGGPGGRPARARPARGPHPTCPAR